MQNQINIENPAPINTTEPSLVLRVLLVIAGTISVIIGVIGIFLPMLPTTPLLLLAAACYARSSQPFYNWLMNNRVFGRYIRNYREGKGLSLTTKIVAIASLWATITYSIVAIIELWPVRILLLIIATAVTTHLLRVKTYRD